MPYMVVFRGSDGVAGYHQAEGLDEAVRHVERLRNEEQAADARLFRMEEIPIEFKTYYKVEVQVPGAPEAAAAPAAAAVPGTPAAPSDSPPEVASAEPGAATEPPPTGLLDDAPFAPPKPVGSGRIFGRG